MLTCYFLNLAKPMHTRREAKYEEQQHLSLYVTGNMKAGWLE